MRKFVLVLLVLMMSMLANGVMAQDSAVFCGNLSAEDCAILEASSAAMATLSSASFDFSLNVAIAGTDGTESQSIAFTVTGDGAYSGDPAMMNSVSTIDPNDTAAVMAAAGEALAALNAELNLSLILPAELATEMAPGFPNQIDLQLSLVDGVGYINFDTLAPLLQGAMPMELSGWGGLDLIDTLTQMGPMLGGMTMPTPDETESMEMSEEDMQALMESMTMERVADMDGQAVFVMNFDIAALMTNPIVRDSMMTSLQTQGQTLSEEDMEEIIQIFAENPDAFVITATQYVDLATNFTTLVEFGFTMDSEVFAAIAEQQGEAMEGEISMAISGSLGYADFNAVPEITAPEGATVLTMQQLFMFLSTGTLEPGS